MKEVLSIPAQVVFVLNGGFKFYPEEFEKYRQRFQFVDLNFIHMLAVYIRMLSKEHFPGYIAIGEDKTFFLMPDEITPEELAPALN